MSSPDHNSEGPDFQQELAAIRSDAPVRLAPLLEQFRPYLLAIAQQELPRQLAGKVGPSDLVQETIVKGYEHFESFAGSSREQLAGWLRQILLNHLRNAAKAFGTEKRDVQREQPTDSRMAAPEGETPSQELASRERQEAFQCALARLPDELRQVIELRHRENRTFVEMGRILGKTEFSVRRLWARAIQQLQHELQHESSDT